MKGQHSAESLQKLLDKFIAKYVLCGKCNYPEVYYEDNNKGKDLVGICNACSFSKKMDTTHKAGKQLLKEINAFYEAHPDFKLRKTGFSDIQKPTDATGSKKKKAMEETKDLAEEEKMNDHIKKLINEGHEISNLDAKEIKLQSEEIGKLS